VPLLIITVMWKGEDYLYSNPEIVQHALENYCDKLEHFKKENPSKPEFLPYFFSVEVNIFIKRIKGIQEILKVEDINKKHSLESEAGLIVSALKRYKNDIQKSLDKLKTEFGDDVPERNDLIKLMSDLDEAIERMNKL